MPKGIKMRVGAVVRNQNDAYYKEREKREREKREIHLRNTLQSPSGREVEGCRQEFCILVPSLLLLKIMQR
jgi:hypothetical protein